jgi:uncharacterized ion transporter superfamily protein YfcC
MSERLSKIAKIVFGTLLSLSIYGLATHAIEWGSDKCANLSAWDGKKIKIIIMVVLLVISVLFIVGDFRKKIIKPSSKLSNLATTNLPSTKLSSTNLPSKS